MSYDFKVSKLESYAVLSLNTRILDLILVMFYIGCHVFLFMLFIEIPKEVIRSWIVIKFIYLCVGPAI